MLVGTKRGRESFLAVVAASPRAPNGGSSIAGEKRIPSPFPHAVARGVECSCRGEPGRAYSLLRAVEERFPQGEHVMQNTLYYGDNLDILREHIASRPAAQTPVFEYP